MKADDILYAIGQVDDDLLELAEQEQPHRRRTPHPFPWRRLVAAAACLCLLAAAIPLVPRLIKDTVPHTGGSSSDDGAGNTTSTETVAVGMVSTLAKAEYPKMAPYVEDYNDTAGQNAWYESVLNQKKQGKGYAAGMDSFYKKTAGQFLTGEAGKNRVYSPLNVYMALSMLAETVDGESRRQILSLLGRQDIAAVRAAAKGLWNANYRDDGVTASILGNSLWLRQDTTYRQDTLSRLAGDYYASAFAGEMGSKDFTATLQNWLNQQTGGLLENATKSVELSPETVMALASTIYFRGSWVDKFHKEKTKKDTFHTAAGDMICEFMNREFIMHQVYGGEGYKAISLGLDGNHFAMWLVQPEEGVDLNTLIAGDVTQQVSRWHKATDGFDYYHVKLSMPKFDVAGNQSLVDGLKNLGVTDIFDGTKADFTPLMDAAGVSVTSATHAARVKVDEDGCEAAAFTLMLAGAGAPQVKGDLDFILDRPFLFFITGTDGVVLFAGAVENPLG